MCRFRRPVQRNSVFWSLPGSQWAHVPLRSNADTVEESRAHPEAIGDHGIDDVVAHYAAFIATLPAEPILVGHSFGAMIAQMTVDAGWREVADSALTWLGKHSL